jgi:S-adenosylmethionine:tRNA ribosyltransferase-isomerase
MRVEDLDYDLPSELIAQEPVRPRNSSRMLVLHRSSGQIEHRVFQDFPRYLAAGDVVVLNDTKVIRARLRGRREPGGGRAEVLLLSERQDGLWEALVTPGRRIAVGRRLTFGEDALQAEVVGRTEEGTRLLRFSSERDLGALVAAIGEVPTPPYIHRKLDDPGHYQTVYARAPGASAAPTAGLHFTDDTLRAVRERVQAVVYITLHVGLGTFRPIHTDRVENHHMHAESYAIAERAAQTVSEALSEGRRVVAVGTSTARALETVATDDGRVRAGAGSTDLFIVPGYRFRAAGALLTNFHMPRSTLLALVCAFASREQILRAYGEAVEEKYRFLSFGDAMLIL